LKRDAVIANQVTKMYKMYSSNKDKMTDLLFNVGKGQEFYALKGVTFTAQEGDCVGLVGMNGSGKSTLANIIGGISMPTWGTITVSGTPSIIAISSGLNGQLTGIENIEVKGLLMGLSIKEINKLKPSIMEFADIGDFIYQPVKTYSSGMKSRLGFAISVNINPDVLIIDEALSVGDETFTKKCLDKMNTFRDKGKTLFFVSHSISQIRKFCNKVMWLEYGVMKAYGETEEVLPMYERFLNVYKQMSKEEIIEYQKKVIENQNHLLIKY